jgi:hypothetical protein
LDASGRADWIAQRIDIACDMGLDQTLSTHIHEVLEVLNSMFGIKLDHDTICQLESGLYAVLKDNGVDLGPLLDR